MLKVLKTKSVSRLYEANSPIPRTVWYVAKLSSHHQFFHGLLLDGKIQRLITTLQKLSGVDCCPFLDETAMSDIRILKEFGYLLSCSKQLGVLLLSSSAPSCAVFLLVSAWPSILLCCYTAALCIRQKSNAHEITVYTLLIFKMRHEEGHTRIK